jgi:hypothetical protein
LLQPLTSPTAAPDGLFRSEGLGPIGGVVLVILTLVSADRGTSWLFWYAGLSGTERWSTFRARRRSRASGAVQDPSLRCLT